MTWNSYLNQIQVSGGTPAEMETFYSMLYRVLLGPTICSDANGDYMGYDGQVHQTADHRVQYANFSGWDIYRSESQLLAMLDPQRAGDMAQSLLLDYQQGGAFPRWGVPNEDSGVMMGDPAAPIIADFYAFGATNFDAQARWPVWSGRRPILRSAPRAPAPTNATRWRIISSWVTCRNINAAVTAMFP